MTKNIKRITRRVVSVTYGDAICKRFFIVCWLR